MGKARLIHIARIPVYKLIEENMESQANSRNQADLIDRFNRWEMIEDELKEKLKYWMVHSPSPYREIFKNIYETIQKIDEAQDEIISDIYFFAQRTYYINFLSNGLLKRFDVTGPYKRRERHVAEPLFGKLGFRYRKSPSTV